MIPNQWYPIYESSRLGARRPVGIRRLGRDLVLWRGPDGGAVALPDRCPHRSARLSRGRLRDGCIECPYHGFRWNSRGECVLIPVNGVDAPIPAGFEAHPITVREEHRLVWMWYGERAEVSATIPWLEAAAWENGSRFTTSFEIDVSYLRVMENMGDFFHFPFVHRRWLPGAGTRLTNFDAHVENEIVNISGTLSPEGGKRWYNYQYPLRAELRLPCIARVEETQKFHLLVVATPIERDRTWIGLRYSEGYVPRWLGGSILARMIAWFDANPVFRWGDVPTLRSQQLDDPGDISHYHLVHADHGIALWFGLRTRAIEQAENQGIKAATKTLRH
ncbi:MAG: aromatic ring-hydroxylating dioxygenase subunit alpha [Candidatus Binataceae bacterium]